MAIAGRPDQERAPSHRAGSSDLARKLIDEANAKTVDTDDVVFPAAMVRYRPWR